MAGRHEEELFRVAQVGVNAGPRPAEGRCGSFAVRSLAVRKSRNWAGGGGWGGGGGFLCGRGTSVASTDRARAPLRFRRRSRSARAERPPALLSLRPRSGLKGTKGASRTEDPPGVLARWQRGSSTAGAPSRQALEGGERCHAELTRPAVSRARSTQRDLARAVPRGQALSRRCGAILLNDSGA